MSLALDAIAEKAAGRPVVTVGEAIVAIVPDAPVQLEESGSLRPHVGGAELNVAVGLARLGRPAAWVGALGDDPLGRLVLRTLETERIDDTHVRVVDGARTALYLREWLPDGRRRPVYYRQGSVAGACDASLWPAAFSPMPCWLHVSGITPALGPNPAALVDRALSWAADHDVPVSFDPNYRPALWDPAPARAALSAIAGRADVLLLSDEDAELLFSDAAPERVLEQALELGAELAVLKRGDRGATVEGRGVARRSCVVAARSVVDPVGAGDGFDAGFLAGLLATGCVDDALELGALVGARAVEAVGEHRYPRRADLPERWHGVTCPPTSTPRGPA